MTQSARPMTSPTGIMPPPGEPRWSRESLESLRWSPRDEEAPRGNDDVEGHAGGAVPGVEERRLVDRPAVHPILPFLSQHTTWSPPTPDHALDVVGVPEIPGAVETITSPRRGWAPKRYANLFTRTRSPILKPRSMDPLGNLERLHHEGVEEQQERQTGEEGEGDPAARQPVGEPGQQRGTRPALRPGSTGVGGTVALRRLRFGVHRSRMPSRSAVTPCAGSLACGARAARSAQLSRFSLIFAALPRSSRR